MASRQIQTGWMMICPSDREPLHEVLEHQQWHGHEQRTPAARASERERMKIARLLLAAAAEVDARHRVIR